MKLIQLSFILFSFLFCVFMPFAFAQTDLLPSIQQRVEQFQSRYGIPLMVNNVDSIGSAISFLGAKPEEFALLDDFLKIFEEEINKYPTTFFKDRQVRAISLVTHLFRGEKPAEGMYNVETRVMAFDFRRNAENKSLKRHSIHHELFHMMAFQTPNYQANDAVWAGLNTDGFVYGEQKKRTWKEVNPYNQGAPYLAGFVTDYAMTSVEEDKAEVFACLMQEKHRMLLTRWSERDAVMRKKIQAIKDFVEVYCPEMGSMYWSLSPAEAEIQR